MKQISTFHPNDGGQVATVVDNKVLIWNVAEDSCKLSCTIVMEGKGAASVIFYITICRR